MFQAVSSSSHSGTDHLPVSCLSVISQLASFKLLSSVCIYFLLLFFVFNFYITQFLPILLWLLLPVRFFSLFHSSSYRKCLAAFPYLMSPRNPLSSAAQMDGNNGGQDVCNYVTLFVRSIIAIINISHSDGIKHGYLDRFSHIQNLQTLGGE